MEKCIKCGETLPAGAKECPNCGNLVSLSEEKRPPPPVQPAFRKQARFRTILILAVVLLSGLLILSLVFGIMLWSGSASPKLVVSHGSLDYGTLKVGSQGSQVLTLSNSGRQDLNWGTDKGKADWLTLDPSQGRIPSGGSQTINVRADTTLLTAGRYSASISFSSNGGQASVSAVLTVVSGPVVAGISPTLGPDTGGTTVTLTGSGFTGASKVLFGTVAASSFTVSSDTQIKAVSPAGSGTVHVTVTTPGGTTTTSNADQFTYKGVQPPIPTKPIVTGIRPTSGSTLGMTVVYIEGKGFTGASKVLFGTTAISNFMVNSDTQIKTASPAGSGTVDVRVVTPGGTSAISNADKFTYVTPPEITSIMPTSGPAMTPVLIQGSGFTNASQVMFGSTPASAFIVNTTLTPGTQITAYSPEGSGTVDVRVITPGGTSAISNADKFTHLSIVSISPTSGPATGGTTVTITGSGFTNASEVMFGSTVASNFTVDSDTQITVVSPAGSGTVDVRVYTPGGTTTTSNADQFHYIS